MRHLIQPIASTARFFTAPDIFPITAENKGLTGLSASSAQKILPE